MLLDLILNLGAASGPISGLWAAMVEDFRNIGEPSALAAFGQVVMIDLLLAADNAIVVGALAAGLPAQQRRVVILVGIIAALVLRIAFALIVTQLMQIVGLIFAGGLLLLWVSWRMWREIRHDGPTESPGSPEIVGDEHSGVGSAKSFGGAVIAVAVADVSMSLDNVLAVAGAAKDHPGILVFGLILAVALMGLAANVIAKYIERYRWLAYLGLAVILFVAGKMIYEGIVDHDVGILQFLWPAAPKG